MGTRTVLVLLGAILSVVLLLGQPASNNPPSEAPTGFDNQTIDPSYVSAADHAVDQSKFEEVDQIQPAGLGPLYNAQSCRECHQNPTSGAVSQVTELRVGHLGPGGRFENPIIPINDGQDSVTGRTLINDRAICAEIQERVPESETIRATRLSLNTLGDGLVEAVGDGTIQAIHDEQCVSSHRKICGQILRVPVLEAPGQTAIGRFGWKNQHASLLSFAADAYLNEMGVTNRLLPEEVTLVCNPKGIAEPNDQPDPTDKMADVDHFARFIRASKAPPRDEKLASTEAAQRGAKLFDKVGCATCHVHTMTTAPAGTKLLAGQLTVPTALGNKTFHPYSDFLLHDVGTGDGIAIAVVEHYGVPRDLVQKAYRDTKTQEIPFDEVDRIMNRQGFSYRSVHDGRNKVRTAPLWGLRTHSRLMHDGEAVRLDEAILRHQGEAEEATKKFVKLKPNQKADLIAFLSSL
jgi:CxxC motif-containing protein (DUF1111 family)